jgi:2,3-bisphosphoglycerate-dependent phosphoglycerate mutase
MVSPDPLSGRLLPAHHLGPGGDSDASVGGTLVLVRHGQSVANAEERFAGWLDVPLTARGEREAIRAAQLMDENGLLPDVVHCSVLTRAKLTADIVLGTLDRSRVPIRPTWRLNERHYGALQGQRKSDVRGAVSEETFQYWRRAFRGRPPAADGQADLAGDPRYAPVPAAGLPRGESLSDVQSRLMPYWDEAIVPDLRAGLVTLIVAHGSPLRALIMHLDAVGEAGIASVNVPTGIPLHYDLDDQLMPRTPGGAYLDPAAAVAGAAKVAAEGSRPPPPPDDQA